MYTLDISGNDKKCVYRSVVIYIGISLFCNAFNIVYAKFGHGVTSIYMTYMFLIPFLLGTVVNLGIGLNDRLPVPFRTIRHFYNSGIATLTVGSCVKGIINIAGSSTILIPVYVVAGLAMLMIAIIKYVVQVKQKRFVN